MIDMPNILQEPIIQVLNACRQDRWSIARYLHDTVCQDLIVLALLLARTQRDTAVEGERDVQRALEMVGRCSNSLRALTFVLTPAGQEGQGRTLHGYVEQLRQETNLEVFFRDEPGVSQAHRDRLTPDGTPGNLVFAAIQTWAASAIGRHSGSVTKIELTRDGGALRMDFLSTLFADAAIEALLTSPLFSGEFRLPGNRTETVPDYPGSSARLIFSLTSEAL